MNKNIETNELIEQYLKGELEGSQLEGIQKLINDDPDFASRVELQRNAHEIIIDGAIKNLKFELNSIHSRQLKVDLIRKHIIGWGLGAIIIGIGLYFILKDTVVPVIADNVAPKISLDTTVHKPGIFIGNSNIDKSQQARTINTQLNIKQIHNTIPDKNVISDIPGENKPDTVLVNVNPDSISFYAGKVKQTDQAGKDNSGMEKVKKTDCRKVKINADLSSSESLNNRPTGRIFIDPKSLIGGLPPYKFSLSKSNFCDSLSFSYLYPGNYNVYASDANNCVVKVGTIVVEQQNNNYQQVFAPLKGEFWLVPLKGNLNGTLKIFTKNGLNVYLVKFMSGEDLTWNGTSLSGSQLPMGVYPFEILYTDGTLFKGNVTIVR